MVETFTGHFEAELTLIHVVEPLTYNDLPVDGTGLAEGRLEQYLASELKHFTVQECWRRVTRLFGSSSMRRKPVVG